MKRSKPLYIKLYEELKTLIINNTLPANTKMDSVRSYAQKHDISTTTVEKAYNQLVIEGYIFSKPRSGFIVEDIHAKQRDIPNSIVDPLRTPTVINNKLTEDLFDLKTYKSIINKVMNYQGSKLFNSCLPSGELELRQEIQKYVKNGSGSALPNKIFPVILYGCTAT